MFSKLSINFVIATSPIVYANFLNKSMIHVNKNVFLAFGVTVYFYIELTVLGLHCVAYTVPTKSSILNL